MKVITIGRDNENNNIVVNDHKVSRIHLQMVLDDSGNYSVVDLNSTNGTFVNGQRITGEVPLKVTDELRIGDTVLPWQSYFSGQVSSETKNPVAPQTSVSQPSAPKKQQKSNSKSKTWLIYVIIGAIVLLLAGGGVYWKIYHIQQKKKELYSQLDKAKNDSIKAAENLKAAEKEYKDALDELEKARKRAEQTNSEDDKKALKKIEDHLRNTKQAVFDAQKESSQANQNLAIATNQLNQVAPERQETKDHPAAQTRSESKEQPKKAEEVKKQTTEPQKVVENTPKEKDNSSDFTVQMQSIVNNWNDKKSLNFCKDQGWTDYNKKKPKEAIYSHILLKRTEDEKKDMFKKMDYFNKNTDGDGNPMDNKKGNNKAKKH